MLARWKQDFAMGECMCAAYMCVSEWGAGEVRQSRLMSEWWQLCDWCNGGRECVSAVHDGRCSRWVMCSLSEWQPDSWHIQYVLWWMIIEFMNRTAALLVKLFLINLKFAKLNFTILTTFFTCFLKENLIIILLIWIHVLPQVFVPGQIHLLSHQHLAFY